MDVSSPIGIIGLGLLGSALAERLLSHGLALAGYDLDLDKCAAVQGRGLEKCATAAEVFGRCDVVLLSLPNSRIVSALLQEVSSRLRPGQTIIDATTGDPAESVEIGRSLAERGVSFLEARVCGSSQHVRQGEATLLLAGNAESVGACNTLFRAISPSAFYLGEVGSASQFKLVHNLILGLNRAVLAEGLQFAQSLGFDAAKALAILLRTPAASRAMEAKGGKMVRGDYEPQATLEQHLKDVDLILDLSRHSGAATPLSELHRRLLQQAIQAGFGEADNSAIFEAFSPARTNGSLPGKNGSSLPRAR